MSQTTFRIAIDPRLPGAVYDNLMLTLRSHTQQLRETEERFDPEQAKAIWEVFVAIMEQVGTVAEASAAVVTLAKAIIEWRKEARVQGVEPVVQIDRGDSPPLDLRTASDETVLAWFLQNTPS